MDNALASISLQLATDIIHLCDGINNRAHIKNQILRSSGSIGANIYEAQYGYSRNDFVCKLQIALKECNETFYWLELLRNSETITDKEAQPLVTQCSRLRFLLVKSINTAKLNQS